MPFAENQGVKIYYEDYGCGEPVILLHGFTNSLQIWKLAGYVDGLKKSYRLLLVDQRGHGKSDKPHHPDDYSLEKRMEDVIAVMNCSGCARASLLGYSMGGWLAFALGLNYPARFVSLIAGGAHPYREDLSEFADIDGSDSAAFINALSAFLGENIPPQFHPPILGNDLVALSAAARKRSSFEARLSGLVLPCLFFAGEKDKRFVKVEACAAKLPHAKMFAVPSAGHVATLLDTDAILPEIKNFLRSVSSAEATGPLSKIFTWLRSCVKIPSWG